MTDDVETHNRRTLWADAAAHLMIACESVEQAQSALADLEEDAYADQLQPLVDTLRRAAIDAEVRKESGE